jgi:histidyl-tRNA synthetase
VSADAELLALGLEIMREFGLTPEDVVARVSDRRLLAALLESLDVPTADVGAVFTVIDKIERQPRAVSHEKLVALGMAGDQISELFSLFETGSPTALRERYGRRSPAVAAALDDLEEYFENLGRLDVAEWAQLDLTVVRGLAYYTGIVFELFDARGELRAICGGGRYDDLLKSLGGLDLPALGFGMGDVVLKELLEARGALGAEAMHPDFWVASEGEDALSDVMMVATRLRRLGASVEYALKPQTLGKQRKAAYSAGAAYFVVLAPDFRVSKRLDLQPLVIRDDGGTALPELVRVSGLTADNLANVVRDNPHVLRRAD